jgi:hypothetical protein
MADNRLLVVEGPDDMHVIKALLQCHNFEPNFAVEPWKGITNLLDELRLRLKRRNFERLGVVVDADSNIASRWASLKGILTNAGYLKVPDHPDPAGTVVEFEDYPRVGIWLMPDNVLPGMLEDYVTLLIPEGNALFGRVKKCVDEIPDDERLCPHNAKVYIHTWLAWQKHPGTPLGLAITSDYLNPKRHRKK